MPGMSLARPLVRKTSPKKMRSTAIERVTITSIGLARVCYWSVTAADLDRNAIVEDLVDVGGDRGPADLRIASQDRSGAGPAPEGVPADREGAGLVRHPRRGPGALRHRSRSVS